MSKTNKKTDQTATLALSDLHFRIEELEKQHQWLLKQIKKKQTELRNFVEQMRSVALELFHKTAEPMKRMMSLDQEIHQLFNEIFNHPNRNFSKKVIKKIRDMYHSFQEIGVISPQTSQEEEDDLDDLFRDINESEESENFGNFRSEFEENQGKQIDENNKKRDEPEAREIRQTFLRLASIFHPDKVTDESSQSFHTKLMQEINKAYQEGDLARLLEIEQKYEIGEEIDDNNEDDLTRQCNRLEKRNILLRNQYEDLKQELRLVKNTSEGELVADYRRAKREKIDLISEMLKQLEKQVNLVKEIRNFVKNFKDKKITVNRFLEGPDIFHTMRRERLEEMIAEMFGDDMEDEFDFF